jgi:CheY-like chemotaxis protein
MKKILVIDDDLTFQILFKRQVESKIKDAMTVPAHNRAEAKEIFKQNPNPALIVMDGCLESTTPDTISLVEEIRKTYKGPMIANSSDEVARHKLVQAGCSHYVPAKEKCFELVRLLFEKT